MYDWLVATDPGSTLIADKSGRLPLHYANSDMFSHLAQSGTSVDEMMKPVESSGERENNEFVGANLLHFAAKEGDVDLAQLLKTSWGTFFDIGKVRQYPKLCACISIRGAK